MIKWLAIALFAFLVGAVDAGGQATLQGEVHGGATVQAPKSAPPVALISIQIAPLTASLTVGATQSFTATGTFSDSSQLDVTTSCVWTSSSTAIVVAGANGISPQVATAVGLGAAAITCTLQNVTSSVQLTVTGVAITGPSPLPQGIEGQPFNATFTADGGTPPYTFSITTGLSALEGVGLTFTSPALTGTLHAPSVGTYGFTVTVHDAGSLTATRNFVLSVLTAGGIRRFAIMPQKWVNVHEADLPNPCNETTNCYTSYMHKDGSGDYVCTPAGLQASMDGWAAAPNNVWWHVIIDDNLSPGGQCVFDVTALNPANGWSGLRLKAKPSGVATGWLIYESAHPNATMQTVCNHMKGINR